MPAGLAGLTLADKWSKIGELRRVVTGALEIERAEKRIGSSLQSHPVVYTTQAYLDVMSGVDGAEDLHHFGYYSHRGSCPG